MRLRSLASACGFALILASPHGAQALDPDPARPALSPALAPLPPLSSPGWRYANLVPGPLPAITPTHFGHNFISRAIASHTPHHNGPDQAFMIAEPQHVEATFAYGDFQVPLPGEKITLYAWSFSSPAPQWVKLGTAKTHASGRIRFEIPAARALPAGVTQVKAVVDGDATEANAFIQVMAHAQRTVVFDLDGTLTTDDLQVAREFLSQMVDGTYVARMIAGGPEVANLYAQHGFNLLYLSARPAFVGDISKKWLMDRGFPFGILHTTDKLIPLQSADAFKTAYLQSMASKGYLLERGYGNADTDITAYANVGIAPDRTFIIGPNGGKLGTMAIQGDYLAHARELEGQF